MKNLFSHPLLILLLRIILGSLFILASLDKIADPNTFAASIMNYKVVNYSIALLLATVLPFLELLCGTLLILGISPRTNSFLISGMLIVFTLLIVSALLRGLDISCGCFSQDPNAGKIGYLKILENSLMILLGIFLFFQSSNPYSILRLFSKRQTS